MSQRDEPRPEAAPANSARPPSFEEGLAQLAELVNRLEGGGLGLSESITAYERGVAILRGLHEELARAEERIRILTTVDDDGRPTLEAFAGTTADGPPTDASAALSAADKVGRRPASRAAAQRRTSSPPTLPGMDDPPPEA